MNRRTAALLTAAAAASAMLDLLPEHALAAEEYRIRDKWGYCQTAHYAESEHFVIFYGNNDTTGKVSDAFLQRNLADYEKLWKCYGEFLGMTDMNVDIYGKSAQKYKTNVYLTNTGLAQYPEGWAFMSAEDGYGIEIISPEAMLDDLTIAHEFGHVVTMQQKAWVDQEITGAWWEPLANWFREMYLSSSYYTGTVRTCWFEPYIRNLNMAYPHGRDYYEVWPFLVYLETNPDDLPGLGQFAVKRLISEAKPGEYPFDTITRLFGTDVQTVFGHYAKRMATFDLGAREAYRAEFAQKLKDAPYYRNLFYTVPQDTGSGWLQAPQWESPMQGGINVIPLQITGGEITAELRGLSDDANAAWQACIVTEDASGNVRYSDLFGSGETAAVSAAGMTKAYLTVSAMPETLYPVNAFHKEKGSPYRTGDERRRYPYEIRLTGASVQQSGGYQKGNGHIHANGGGWVADTAKVSDSAYVGPEAMVLGNAKVSGEARITDHAVVAGDTVVQDHAVISGYACVHGGGWVYADGGWKSGSVTISGNAVVSGSAVVTGMCSISGNASVMQKAYVCDAVMLKDRACAKGTSYLTGSGVYSGQAITDGDYANEEQKNSGVGFGWLDEGGWHQTAEGHLASYDFADRTGIWGADAYTATGIRLNGAEWAAERTSAKGVVSFDGGDGCLQLDSGILLTDDLQISLGVLWKGGQNGQELLHFGDDRAYLMLTPSDADGKTRLTVSDGRDTYSLTAPAFSKGEWHRVTLRFLDGTASLLIDGQQADRKACSVTPLDVMCAAESDLAVVGKGFRGALDDIRFSYQETAEPQIRYTGSEPADDSPLRGDVNADGMLSVADAVMLCRYLTGEGSVTDWQAGDLNADSRLGADDLTLLKRLLLG
ncbi:MAG: N-acetylglucosamine-1-phosphate uridyltransferase [Oscillospiraceae bacterium]|nr:N-acetylglucosamine-1-phosphate uridyltransferase [Oscillospiraceae bacterium]